MHALIISGILSVKSYNKSLLELGNMGKYSVLWLCSGWANTATLPCCILAFLLIKYMDSHPQEQMASHLDLTSSLIQTCPLKSASTGSYTHTLDPPTVIGI